MFFSKNRQRKPSQIHHDEKSLYPILHVTDSLKSYQKELAKKEVESLFELGMIGQAFDSVLSEADTFQSQLLDFGQSFSNISQSADRFGQVREDITQTVWDTQRMVSELMDTSLKVQKSYGEMESTFSLLQNAINGIQKCMGKIVSIADETNILAINASIEAARAGEQGKGFAIVAEKVRELAKEIKELTDEVDSGVHNVESGASQLSSSIQASQQTLGAGTDIVNKTYESFGQITSAAETTSSVQGEISDVISQSQQSLQVICQFFDNIKSQYDEVVKHIRNASRLGTTKSAMFEDMDNMLSQVPPIINDANP